MLAVFGLIKRTNGLDYKNGAHKIPRISFIALAAFVNISKFVINQRLIIGVINVWAF